MEPFSLSSQPLMIPLFLVGITVGGGMVIWFREVKSRGRLCSRCASTTISLVPGFPLRLLGKGVITRWCPDCDWKGIAFRPTHERRGRRGKIRVKGAFRWGRSAPSPGDFFEWSGPERRGADPITREAGTDPPDAGQEQPVSGFHWGDKGQISNGAGFSWGRSRAQLPPPPPFHFAGQPGNAPEHSPPMGPPPAIPFHFAEGNAATDEEPPKDPGDTRNIPPKLGFRWKG